MRVFAFVWAASLALLAAPAGAAPQRVASLNLCTDELLLMLGQPDQIASVTHLSHKPAETILWRRAKRYPLNDGSLLSVARLRPDLVLTMGGGGGDKIGIARRLGFRIVDLPYPQNLRDIERSIATLAGALGRPEQGRQLLRAIATLRETRPKRQIDTVWLGGGGRSVGATGLAAQWMALAGLKQRALAGDRISLEQMLTHPPDLLLRSNYRAGQYSVEQRWLSHRIVRGSRSPNLHTDGRRWTCMGPTLISEVLQLRRATS